ncbi:hypothetical protein HETIRDRAFT_115135 [Heterobasidion irregulare TC 32-1]|uniref:Uncharacterized protein n=1 Tax=Heterobasidion irregulare (strain TC 32-1) TaxID=747525 RepID=W4KIN5_HETIT|nr:uncharacterized protein HETIRDRAFT_115135 [Heterobasidion irregulare TC 32-1]ETW85718.1 hypothetical protein HETIRDRAFT_115135 [Heterobasidion irregulare TC 32-1]
MPMHMYKDVQLYAPFGVPDGKGLEVRPRPEFRASVLILIERTSEVPQPCAMHFFLEQPQPQFEHRRAPRLKRADALPCAAYIRDVAMRCNVNYYTHPRTVRALRSCADDHARDVCPTFASNVLHFESLLDEVRGHLPHFAPHTLVEALHVLTHPFPDANRMGLDATRWDDLMDHDTTTKALVNVRYQGVTWSDGMKKAPRKVGYRLGPWRDGPNTYSGRYGSTATLSRSHKNSPSRGNLGRCVKDRVDRPEWSHGKHPDSVSLGASGNTLHQGSRKEVENMRCAQYEVIVCRGGSSTGRPPTLACFGRFENRASFDGSIMIHAVVSHHVARINWRDASGSRSIDGWNGSSKGSWTGWGRMITERRKDSPWLTSDLELTDSDGRDGEREWDDRGMLN